jgi:hypothetical protein
MSRKRRRRQLRLTSANVQDPPGINWIWETGVGEYVDALNPQYTYMHYKMDAAKKAYELAIKKPKEKLAAFEMKFAAFKANNLKPFKAYKKHLAALPKCPICDDILQSEETTCCVCTVCITRWLKKKNDTCPICRICVHE